MSLGKKLNEFADYSEKKENRIILVKREAIYLGIIASVGFAIITYVLDLLILVINDYFRAGLNQYIVLTIKIIILLIFFSVYVNYVQFVKFKEEN